jgi:hypothetical protein
MPSYEGIDFGLRPAKHVERKMIVEVIGRLTHLRRLPQYRYVGFGSVYFSDFILLHKVTGISRMISIEQEEAESERFVFNKPFRCVRMLFGAASDVLPLLSWKQPTILWLDYDGRLDAEKLDDIAFFCANAPSDSMLVVTVNAHPTLPNCVPLTAERVRGDIHGSRAPAGLTDASLRDWGTADTYATILFNEIDKAIGTRNGFGTERDIAFKDLFNFQYKDSVRMLTVGGLLHRTVDSEKVKRCRFNDLYFVRDRSDPFVIPVPRLTYREVRFLDALLPSKISAKTIAKRRLPADDVAEYARIYRYFPTFADAHLN